jgi:hypothetical protein
MGHQRLGKLPTTRKWEHVVALLSGGADAIEVGAAVASASEASLSRASDDPTLRHAVYLLARIPLAARDDGFGHSLRRLGLEVSDGPNLIEIATAMTAALDEARPRRSPITDLSEMATLAATESLFAVVSREGDSLFGTTYAADEARAGLWRLATNRGFELIARDFFARLTRRYLDYYLSRVMADHVGMNRRFPTIKDRNKFDEAMQIHCREVSVIIGEFASGWYGKTEFEGGITLKKAGGFAYRAFEKVRKELRMRHMNPADA